MKYAAGKTEKITRMSVDLGVMAIFKQTLKWSTIKNDPPKADFDTIFKISMLC